jgi:hypothetical protein
MLSLAVSVRAQVTTGTIVGTVQDTSGAVIPDAKVTVTNAEKRTSLAFQTQQNGSYFAPFLIPGTYDVKVEKTGFRSEVQSGINVQVDQQLRVDFTLNVGQVTQTVEVNAKPPLVQTDNASMGQVITQTPVEALPLNGRNFAQLVYLSTGVTTGQVGENLSGSSSFNPRAASDFNALGSQAGANAWLVDGIVNNEETFNTVILQPPVESIQEFKVLTGVFSSEFGRGAGVVSVSTRSGSNQIHGSAMDYVRNTLLNARNFFAENPAVPKPPFDRNQFEATFGGPLVIPKVYDGRDHTFMFFDYFGERQIQGLSFVNTVPTQYTRIGDFTHYTQNGSSTLIPIYDPTTTTAVGTGYARSQFACGGTLNLICPHGTTGSPINSVGLAIMSLYPLPNTYGPGGASNPYNFNNYYDTADRDINDNGGIARIDHTFSQSDSMFVRYSYERFLLSAPQGQSACCLPSNPAQISQYNLGPWVAGVQVTQQETQGLAADETHIFRPNLVNDFRAGYTRFNVFSHQSDYGDAVASALGIQNVNVNQFTSGIPNISPQDITGLSGGPTFLPDILVETFEQVEDNVSWVKGRHQMKFGFRGRNLDYMSIYGVNTRSALTFNDNFTNNAGAGGSTTGGAGIATGLLGYLTTGTRGFLFAPYYYETKEVASFFEDDWKVNRKLTVNLGIRYDLFPSPVEKFNRIANFDPTADTLIYAGVSGTPRDVNVQTHYHNFSPRIGFAYDLTGSGKTVIRAGYGIAYFPLNPSDSAFTGDNVPFTVSQNFTEATYPLGTAMSSVPTINNPFGPPVSVQPMTTAALNAANPLIYSWAFGNQTPYMQTYNFDVQRQLTGTMLFEVSYAGSRGLHLQMGSNINEVEPGTGSNASRRLIQPLNNVATINYYFPGNMSNFNSLQAKLQKYLSNGLQFLVSYTYSKSLDYAGSTASGGGAVGGPQTYTNIHAGYGPSGFDITNRFVASWVYLLPFGKERVVASNPFLKRLVDGWEFDGISSLQSGFPFSITLNQGVNNGAPSWPNAICNGRLSNHGPNMWFNTACFPAPAANTYGDVSRGFLWGPGLVDFDLSLVKNTHINERVNLQFRADAFNAFNTPSFSVSGIGTAIGSGTAGTITSTNVDNREFQLALKLVF